ncbi:NAD-dependent DNA ligase LigA [Conexibacter stalactiti]|uniref:DNA ligase n=1 Tax=Conexibacter stalactiti TaxID=1940611 RepID=A0ABU4HN31_9ACTN|nr:NAD-dependent DNA ligase LigA [Conexibacter stalactiti]MDW5594716.1 NAD-dependent DNA ligase LigA [Conexibacter stalactiti]MEC5035358.1 NAD-dependent DNA ligase LigA [Conexibacter stalactiti]
MPQDVEKQARELAAQIERHRALYARGVPELVDADYDALEERLRALLADNPELALPDNPLERPWSPELVPGQTIRHSRPMLSLEKATTDEQLDAFCERFPGQPFRVTPKLDGISLAIAYQDGELEYVATRGDGRDGERVTEKVRHVVLGLPLSIDAPGRVEVRGEAVMLRSVFDAYNDTHPDRPLVNPRNAAAGTLVHKSPEGCVREGRTLRFRAFDLFEDAAAEAADPDAADVFARMGALGFELPDVLEAADGAGVRGAIGVIAGRRGKYDFDIDGAVVRLASRRAFEAAGATGAAPRGALAWKYPAEERETVLRAVTWPVGKIGRVVPRAEVDPVFVGGTTVTFASLHNPRLVRERDIRVGDTVRIMRRGDVIPFIAGSVAEKRTGAEQPVEYPTHCPSCGTELVVKGTGEELWCENLQCPAQSVRRLIHWSSRHAADMEGVGTTWIEKLAEDGVLRRPSDFYALTTETLIAYERMGETSAGAMVASIERSRAVGLRRALIGLAIPMASEGVAKRLCLAGFERIEQLAEATVEQLEGIRDIGPKVAASLVAYFARPEVREELVALRAAGVDLDVREEDRPLDVAEAAETPLKGATVVVSGGFSDPDSGQKVPRPAVVRLLELAGATSATSVSRATTYLITGADVGAAKTDKAARLGVAVVDQAQAWQWLAEAGVR